MPVKLFLSLILFACTLFSKDIGIYEQQDKEIDLNLKFTNEYNEVKTLKQIINNKPTILTINYFNCPTLCSPMLYEVADVIQNTGLTPYDDFNIITLSIEKNDTFKHAKQTKDRLFKTLKKAYNPKSWTFLTTTNQEDIDTITNSVGFKYERRVKDGVVDYLHPAAIMVLTPNGKVSRYLNGIRYLPFDLKLALIEASNEETRPTIANTLLYCFAYDAESKTYLFKAEKFVGGFIFLVVVLFFTYMYRAGKKDDAIKNIALEKRRKEKELEKKELDEKEKNKDA